MKRTQIYLTEEIVAFIKTFGSTRHLSQSDIVRTAIEQYMKQVSPDERTQTLKKYAGLWKNHDFNFRNTRKSWDR